MRIITKASGCNVGGDVIGKPFGIQRFEQTDAKLTARAIARAGMPAEKARRGTRAKFELAGWFFGLRG